MIEHKLCLWPIVRCWCLLEVLLWVITTEDMNDCKLLCMCMTWSLTTTISDTAIYIYIYIYICKS